MNWWLVYLVSVIDGLNVGVGMAAAVAVAAAAAGLIVVVVFSGKYGDADTVAKGEKVLKISVPVAIALMLVSAAVPSTQSLLRAYLMVEGSKIVNAENAEKATAEVVKRIDKAIEVLGGKATE